MRKLNTKKNSDGTVDVIVTTTLNLDEIKDRIGYIEMILDGYDIQLENINNQKELATKELEELKIHYNDLSKKVK